jgi:hypothetical protein
MPDEGIGLEQRQRREEYSGKGELENQWFAG